ncbi:response regulator [Ketobacter sp.]|uniref:response regulator n=1 Tax=Ketobacter sp. TaxID=2083498 RepID=UPI000F238801|nr:response regulator [Ketobacter sp.]RLT94502.1 MAG: response regulator [Ketobacter sp.]
MKFNQNAKIRLHILSIALIGGLGFLCYLLANVFMASQNERRLDELLNRQHPVIEQVQALKRDIQVIRETMTSAVALEDPFLVEDSEALSRQVEARLQAIAEIDPELQVFTANLGGVYRNYYDISRQLAVDLIEHPGELQRYQLRIDRSHQIYDGLMDVLDRTLVERQTNFALLLRQTDAAVKEANLFGALLGGFVILALLLLAWIISVRVLREINRTNRLKDEFLGTISHEMRTPMNGIIGSLNLLSKVDLTEDQRVWLDAATRSAGAMMLSIDDILELSEIMSGREQVEVAAVRLRPLLDKLLVTYRPELESKGLTLECRFEEVVDQLLECDEKKVGHVIRHLLSNAIKFSPEGEIVVSVSRIPAYRGSAERVSVVIQDSGPGIDPLLIKELFKPFQQADGSSRRQFQGMGIGLSICRAIAQLLGGHIYLENRVGGGLSVEFCFPLRSSRVSAPAPDKTQPRVAVLDRVPLVLVVEDNPVNQMVIKGYLKRLGCEVITANNGKEALELVGQRPVDLVFMDCQMPVMDGFEATRKMREMAEPVRSLPIIAVTANAMDADRRLCLQSGMDGYLKKPVAMDDIESELKAYVSHAA